MVFWARHQPGWLQMVTAIGVGTQLAVGLATHHHAGDAAPGSSGGSTWSGATLTLAVPGCWPLIVALVVLTVIAVRGRSSRERRPQPDP